MPNRKTKSTVQHSLKLHLLAGLTLFSQIATPAHAIDPTASNGWEVQELLAVGLTKAWANNNQNEYLLTTRLQAIKIYDRNDIVFLEKLSGTPFDRGKAKGTITTTILFDGTNGGHGLTESTLTKMRTLLANPENYCIAEVCRKTWQLGSNGIYFPNDVPPAPPAKIILGDYQAATDSFLLYHHYGSIQTKARIFAKDVMFCGRSAIIAKIDWKPENKNHTSIQNMIASKMLEQTSINCGDYAYLKIPFQKQEQTGKCAAAVLINVLEFLCPKIGITQKELFALFNKTISPTDITQAISDLHNIGFDAEAVLFKGIPPDNIDAKLQTILDSGNPIIAAGINHAEIIIGYNKAEDNYIVWDPKMDHASTPNVIPDGAALLTQKKLLSDFKTFLILHPASTASSLEQDSQIRKEIGPKSTVEIHAIASGKEPYPSYASRAIPIVWKSLLSEGRFPVIKAGNKVVKITHEESGKWFSKTLPDGKEVETGPMALVPVVAHENGRFFSVSD